MSPRYTYVRAEYPLAIQRLRTAIRQAERAGLLGNDIAGTTFSFSIAVRLGAGAFVCGEETALIASIEGKRGQPRPRPPYPAELGLYSAQQGQTIIQVAREAGIYIPYMCNVEGLSNVGACRLCLVEVQGQRRLLPACTTEVTEGMVVATDNERLRKYRKMIVEMMFAERNHICAVCVSNGHCG